MVLTQAANKTGLPVQAVEKDLWVTVVLQAVFALPVANHLVFKGGTSLSKVWKVIHRFSEDIDLAIDPSIWGFEGDLTKKQIKRLRKASSIFVRDVLCQSLQEAVAEIGLGKWLLVEADPDGDKTVDMTMIIRSSTASDYNCKAVAEYLKQVYAELGVNINIEIVDSSLYKERQQEGSYDMTLTVFGINNADPTSTFKQYFASEGNSNKTLNYNYYNEKIDELVAKAPTIADVEERSKIYDEIQDRKSVV